MKSHHFYWLWVIITVPLVAFMDMVFLAPILVIFPPIIFGCEIVVGPERTDVKRECDD